MSPVYNSVISRSEASALMPEDVTREVITHLPTQSAALSMFRHVPMSRAQTRMPVESALAVAYWVNGDTGLKQTTEQNWTNKYLNAEELAAIVPIPESVLDDADYDIWALIRPTLTEAIGRALDAAVFMGTNKPASWPAAIAPAAVTAGNVAVSGTSTPDKGGIMGDFSTVFGTVEADGYDPNGVIATRLVKAALRNARATTGEQLANPPAADGSEVYGVQVQYPMRGLWPTGAGALQAIAGDFSQGMLGVRQDITFKVLDQAVIMDASTPPQILFNLAQQDMVALRVVARFAFQVPNPMTYDQPTEANRYPFGVLNAA
jgi:HK97 family phage major capsid protein